MLNIVGIILGWYLIGSGNVVSGFIVLYISLVQMEKAK